jgi:Carboxypeptidase regulatory-like domain
LLRMRGRAFLFAFAAAASLVYGDTATAVAVERIPVSGAGRAETAGFPPGVFLTLVSPAQYVAAAPGRWIGPEYWASGNTALRGRAVIDWSVSFRDRSVEPDSAAAAATPRGWREQERAGIAVPHVAGRNVVGTLPSYFVLKHNDAAHETALAVPISATAIAIVKFSLKAPESSSAEGAGDFVVQGSFGASSWNRGQAFLALAGVKLEGTLPPAKVSIEAVRRKLAVRGTVVDAFEHAIVGARIVLERRLGLAWRAVGSARTDAQGTYTVRAGVPGRYRVSVARTRLRSGSVPVRK